MTVHLGSFRKSETDPLLEPLIAAPLGRSYVIAQLGQSLDGRIATPTGESRWINRGAALDHLHRLRAHVDAVVVGVGTVVDDDPELTVRRVQGANPARVVIDPRGRTPGCARCLSENGVRRLIVTGPDCAPPKVQGAEIVAVKETVRGSIRMTLSRLSAARVYTRSSSKAGRTPCRASSTPVHSTASMCSSRR